MVFYGRACLHISRGVVRVVTAYGPLFNILTAACTYICMPATLYLCICMHSHKHNIYVYVWPFA